MPTEDAALPNLAVEQKSLMVEALADLAARMLEKAGDGCEPAVLARLMGLAEADMRAVAAHLTAENMILEDGFGRWRSRRSGRHAAAGRAFSLPGSSDLPPAASLAFAFQCHLDGRFLDGFRLNLNVLRDFTSGGYPLTARRAYDIICRQLLDWKAPQEDRELCAAFVRYGLQIQEEMLHFPWNVRGALALCYKLRGVAFRLGDLRSLSFLDMIVGYLNINRRATVKAAFYQGVMLRGITAIRNLGDADILMQAQGMLCFFHFVEGEFARAINCAYASLYLPEGSGGNFNASLYCHATLSAAAMGEFDVALSILALAVDRANRAGRFTDERNIRAFLAYVHLLRHDEEEALAVIDDLISTPHLSVLTYADLWASRCLAYYHYLRGNILQSYTCFKSWQENNSAAGVIHDNYLAAPFVLDMLASYYLAGFPPPLQHTLAEELDQAMASPSRLLRATAWRIAGEVQAHEVGWNDKTVIRNLKQSLSLLRTISAPMDTARTLLSLARALLAKGDKEGVRAMVVEAWSIHSRYGQPAWPAEFSDFVQQGGETGGVAGLSPAAFCLDLFQAMRQQYNWESDEAFFRSLLCALLAAFGMTRGGLFRGEVAPVPLAFVGGDAPEPIRERMLKEGVGGRRAVFRRQETEQGWGENAVALLLAVDAEEFGRYFVWLSGAPRRQVELSLGDDLFTVLSDFLGTEICVHLRRSAAWQDHMRSVVSSSAPRLAEAGPILFRTECMRQLVERVDLVAVRDATVLILGESGVGKELVARRLHALSGRQGEFVAVNLASTPDDLFESEFYGHEKGSFTGANYQKRGLFELADKGTLFIDEVGDVPPRLQVKLLRVLQEKRFLRVGGTRFLSSDFRLVAATNRNLEAEVRAGRFREDLYYRLNVVPLHVPPLRERAEDVLFLAENFLRFFSERHEMTIRPFSEAELAMLRSYAWPGNVRELKNYVERRTLLPEQTVTLAPDQMSGPVPVTPSLSAAPASMEADAEGARLFQSLPSLEAMQNAYFEHVFLRREGAIGGKNGVAATLGISRSTAYAWIEKLGLRDRFERRLVVRCPGVPDPEEGKETPR